MGGIKGCRVLGSGGYWHIPRRGAFGRRRVYPTRYVAALLHGASFDWRRSVE